MEALLAPLVGLAQAGMARGVAAARRLSLAAACAGLAGIAATAATGCGLAALWYALLPHLGPAWTALVLAGVLALLCLALLAVAYIVGRRDSRPARIDANAGASLLVAARLFQDHKGTLMLAALIAGLATGARSGGGR